MSMPKYYSHLSHLKHRRQDAHRNQCAQQRRQDAQCQRKTYPNLSQYLVLRAWYEARKQSRRGDYERAYICFTDMLNPRWRIE